VVVKLGVEIGWRATPLTMMGIPFPGLPLSLGANFWRLLYTRAPLHSPACRTRGPQLPSACCCIQIFETGRSKKTKMLGSNDFRFLY